MKKAYYYLASALPSLEFGKTPEMNFESFAFMLKLNLDSRDYAQTVVIRRFYDFENLRAFWENKPLNKFGTMDKSDLQESLSFPSYVNAFLDRYDKIPDRLKYFSQLISAFFREEILSASGFLRKYLQFEREWRLVLVGLRAKLLGRDLITEMQNEDPGDEFTAQIIGNKDAKTFEPPAEYSELKSLYFDNHHSPILLHNALNKYRFDKIETLYGNDVFGIDRILAYLAQFIISVAKHSVHAFHENIFLISRSEIRNGSPVQGNPRSG